MSDEFPYDVFLSHSMKDKAVVRDVAERLRKDGRLPKVEVRRVEADVPFHPSSFKLHPFRDWAQLESGPFQMQGHHTLRDPLNKERRFLPLRLDDALIKGSLAQF